MRNAGDLIGGQNIWLHHPPPTGRAPVWHRVAILPNPIVDARRLRHG
jgi:hypothetical protein